MINNNTNQRPKFLNLLKIRLPVTAVASILHRVSGVILFLLLAVVIYGLGLSLQGVEAFNQVKAMLSLPIFQLFIFLVGATTFYHLLAGIRFLLLDLDIGHQLTSARRSAVIVILLSIIFLLILYPGVFW